MALIKWRGNEYDPFREILDIQRVMNRLFDTSLVKGSEIGLFRKWSPSVDISDEKDKILIKADLPGVKQDNLNVDIEDSVLTIKGERKEESEKKEKNYYQSERFYGNFVRSFTLPSTVDAAKTKATYKDGVLEIVLPKKEEAKPKTIKVEINK